MGQPVEIIGSRSLFVYYFRAGDPTGGGDSISSRGRVSPPSFPQPSASSRIEGEGMSTGIRRLLAMSLATGLMLAVVWLIASHDQANAQVENTCNDVGFTNLTASTSGVWGSVTFDADEPTLTLVVEEGFEVRLCVKAGSAQQGDGPEITDWFGEGTHEVAHSSGKELSHYGLEFREVTTSTTSTTVIGPPPPPPTTTTTTLSSSTTTEPSSTTTTSTPGSTSTVPQSSTTTMPETTTSSTPFAPSTTHNTPSPEELPFTGIEDWLAPLAIALAVAGLVALAIAGRLNEE